MSSTFEARSAQLREVHLAHVHHEGDRLFRLLLPLQWAVAVVLALATTPFTFAGASRAIHPHVWIALVGGAALTAAPLALIWAQPGRRLTRHVVVVAQMLFSGLLIHVTGGRIETHFHVFGSLAFIAFYRDPGLLVTATLAVTADHVGRGWLWPAAVYGVPNPAWWRFLEHAAWMVFEDIVLAMGIHRSLADIRRIAEREAALTQVNDLVEQQVNERTAELAASREQFRSLVETTQAIPWEVDLRSGVTTYIGPKVEAMLGYPPAHFGAAHVFTALVHRDDLPQMQRISAEVAQTDAELELECELRFVAADGHLVHTRSLLSALGSRERRVLRGVSIDISRQKQLEADARAAHRIQSLGRVAASVAHEVNTPLQYIGDNVRFLADAARRLIQAVDRIGVASGPTADTDMHRKVAEILRRAKIDRIRDGIEGAHDAATLGLEQVRQIVRALQSLTGGQQHGAGTVVADECVRTAAMLAHAEFPEIVYQLELEPIGAIACDGVAIGQAVLGLLRNAAEATREHLPTGAHGRIEVRGRRSEDSIAIEVRDFAGGIPVEIRDRLFEPFFTTRGEGHGTGEGLHRIRDIVEGQHGGQLIVHHESDGTTFTVVLPRTLALAA